MALAGGCDKTLTLITIMTMGITLSSDDVDSKLEEWATLDVDSSSCVELLLVKDLRNVLLPRRSISVNRRLSNITTRFLIGIIHILVSLFTINCFTK